MFTIFYNRADLAVIDVQLHRLDLPLADLTLAQSVLLGGWKADATATKTILSADATKADNDADCRSVTISGVKLQDFRDWLYRRAKEAKVGNPYCAALANDMAGASGAVETISVGI